MKPKTETNPSATPKLKIEGVAPRPRRLSLHPLQPHEATRAALTAGKVKTPKKAEK